MTLRLAMWSGPRNLSTALMRSFEARGDCHVSDEPLYAHYLQQTGLDHPGAAEILAHSECDAKRVVAALLDSPPSPHPIWYVKHMAHHLLPSMDRTWVAECRNAFLVREPEPMILSLAKALGRTPRLEETGLPQQLELATEFGERGSSPLPRISAESLSTEPGLALRKLCKALEIEYTDAMLSWPPGRRPTDGIWAPHWYASVELSTGFEHRPPKPVQLPRELDELARRARPLHEQLLDLTTD